MAISTDRGRSRGPSHPAYLPGGSLLPPQTPGPKGGRGVQQVAHLQQRHGRTDGNVPSMHGKIPVCHPIGRCLVIGPAHLPSRGLPRPRREGTTRCDGDGAMGASGWLNPSGGADSIAPQTRPRPNHQGGRRRSWRILPGGTPTVVVVSWRPLGVQRGTPRVAQTP
jgi:hypothetical protein